jgi:hypothetical protein
MLEQPLLPFWFLLTLLTFCFLQHRVNHALVSAVHWSCALYCSLSQDRVVRYGLGAVPNSDAVFQWRSVHATFYTPMDLRAFPFDRQQLLIQV